MQYHYSRSPVAFNYTVLLPVTTTGVMTTGSSTTGSMTTGSMGSIQSSTASTTGAGTTGSLQPPPVLSGYAYSTNLVNNFTNGLTPVSLYLDLYYTINPTGTISIGLVGNTGVDGWLGFGWSVSGNMTTNGQVSDAVLAYVDGVGNVDITDFDITGRNPPSITNCATTGAVCPDVGQAGCADQVTNKMASRNGVYLTVQFTRPLAASDVCDIAIVPNGKQDIIFAIGPVTSGGVWPYSAQFHIAHTIVPEPYTFSYVAPPPTTQPICVAGTLGCPCFQGTSCNSGLVCRNAICVTSAASSNTICLLLTFVLVIFGMIQ